MSVPYNETQRVAQTSDTMQSAKQGSLQVNNLVYKQPSSLTTTTNRTQKISYFQRSEYKNGDTMICDVNSGTDYINPHSSYLSFKLNPTTAGAAVSCNFGSGSALNIIQDVSVRTRGGVELDRIEAVNYYQRIVDAFEHSDSWFKSSGTLMGYGPNRDGVTDEALTTPTAQVMINIPLSKLSGFFNPVNKTQLVPASLMSGLHMEIKLVDNGKQVFFLKTGTPGDLNGYELKEVQLILDCHSLSESTQKTLNMQSANGGLEYCYPRVYTSKLSQSGSILPVNIQIRKAVSQAEKAFTLSIDDSTLNDEEKDGFKSLQNGYEYQSRVGNLYYPWTKTGDSSSSRITALTQSLMMFNKSKDNAIQPSVVDRLSFALSYGLIPACFTKSQNLPFSGVPLNNSRSLEVSFTNLNTGVANYTYYTFLQYLAVAKSWLSNTACAI